MAETIKSTAQAQRKTIYDQRGDVFKAKLEQARMGARVIKAKKIPFEQNRQGLIRWYVAEDASGLASDSFFVFVSEIHSHSGRHTHQGGVTIFVLQGKGYSMVDGVRYDWGPGDMIMLPIKSGGCDHQHFNLDSRPSRWLALRSRPLRDVVGHFREQKEEHPDWKG